MTEHTLSDTVDCEVVELDRRRVWCERKGDRCYVAGESLKADGWRRGSIAVEVGPDLQSLRSRAIERVVVDDLRRNYIVSHRWTTARNRGTNLLRQTLEA